MVLKKEKGIANVISDNIGYAFFCVRNGSWLCWGARTCFLTYAESDYRHSSRWSVASLCVSSAKRAPTTDYRPPTTSPIAVASLCVSSAKRAPTTDHRLPTTSPIAVMSLCIHWWELRPDHRPPTTSPIAVASLCVSSAKRAPTTDYRLPNRQPYFPSASTSAIALARSSPVIG